MVSHPEAYTPEYEHHTTAQLRLSRRISFEPFLCWRRLTGQNGWYRVQDVAANAG